MKASLVAAAILLGTSGAALHAQIVPRASVDLIGGLGTALHSSADYVNPASASGELTLAYRRASESALAGVFGVSAGGQARLWHSDLCLYRNGACAPELPAYAHLGVLGGTEYLAGPMPLRLLAGTALYVSSGGTGVGAQLHLDLASPRLGRFALVLSARTSLVAQFNGERVQLGALGAGLRLY